MAVEHGCNGVESRAFFFDVDGTIVWHEPGVSVEETVARARPSAAVASAFARLREQGHHTFICTGRPLGLLSDMVMELNPTGLITADGACVSVNGAVVADEVMDPALAREVAERAVDAGVDVMFEGSSGSVTLTVSGSAPETGLGEGMVRSADELCRTTDLAFSKFVVREADRAKLMVGDNEKFFMKHFDVYDLGLSVFEMACKGVNKGSGVRRALELMGVDPACAMAFGDSGNDLPMAKAVGTFVAMGNALPAVKDAADYVTDPVESDGVVTALEHFGIL